MTPIKSSSLTIIYTTLLRALRATLPSSEAVEPTSPFITTDSVPHTGIEFVQPVIAKEPTTTNDARSPALLTVRAPEEQSSDSSDHADGSENEPVEPVEPAREMAVYGLPGPGWGCSVM